MSRALSSGYRLAESVRRRRQRSAEIGPDDINTEGRGRTALVTGASAGIGREIATLLAAKGFDVVLVARRAERLEQITADLEARFDVTVHAVPSDLSRPGAAQEIADQLGSAGIPIDYLVNNAASALFGKFLRYPLEAQRSILYLDCVSVVEMCHLFLPRMIEKRWGRIINVTSVGGLMSGTPEALTYGSSKALTTRFTEGLAAEYAADGINVTASVPGVTDTEWFEATGMQGDKSPWVKLSMMPAATVAREAYAACEQGNRFIVHGLPGKIWGTLVGHAPRPVRYRLVKWIANTSPDQVG